MPRRLKPEIALFGIVVVIFIVLALANSGGKGSASSGGSGSGGSPIERHEGQEPREVERREWDGQLQEFEEHNPQIPVAEADAGACAYARHAMSEHEPDTSEWAKAKAQAEAWCEGVSSQAVQHFIKVNGEP